MHTRTFAEALTVVAILALPVSSFAQKPMELTARRRDGCARIAGP